jgi:hypothetical protein
LGDNICWGQTKMGGQQMFRVTIFLGSTFLRGQKMMGSKFVGGPNLGVQHFKWGKFFKLSKNVGGQKGGKI